MKSQESVEGFLEYLGDAVVLVNSEAIVEYANTSCLKLFGYKKNDFFGKNVNIVLEEELREKHTNNVRRYIKKSSAPKRMMSRLTFNCVNSLGKVFVARISIATLKIGGESFGLAIIQDYSVQQTLVEELEHKVNTDALTMLYNRHYLETITLSDSRWFKSRQSVAVLYLDLNNFKPINDSYGHAFGDFILKKVAFRIKESLRQEDLVFRIGGDEFIVLVDLEFSDVSINTVKNIANKVAKEISRPISIDKDDFLVSASIGIGIYPQDFDDLEIIIKLADKAMFHAKKNNKAIVCISELPSADTILHQYDILSPSTTSTKNL